MIKHSYAPYVGDMDSSERQHLLMLNHFRTKGSFERFEKTEKEKEKTNDAIRGYINKNRKPLS